MKKILVVGFMPYGYMDKLVEKYPDVLWFQEQEVGMSDKAMALIELVEMMDGVMFMGHRNRLTYEVVCSMTHKDIYEKNQYPVAEDPKEEEKPF